ncbi:MDR family MFS transporter [Saccharopolyspora gloriosae]|uniref:EmrB/QacA subfamily drug resistance transporter n=1 Tax=Saccharopolyspora gloriosae TaxID=455344 RepID=A0A840N773_9PSEU|nr:MDR family MFS transporter [Saccharopolyspora gloriosae]MBB5067820.1 EmrB/QacA subfamily drug resistance transporter [Saccharopolyspora gloriosae]
MRRLEYKWLVGITFVLGLIMQILDMTVLNVALATLGREFHVGEGTLQWVLTGYMISLAVFVPSSGWIADRFGSKRTFQLAVVLFTLASVLCGLATEMWMLIGARILQGVGGGMLVPVGQAMLFRAFPANERAKASAVLSIPITIAPTLGPLLGGVLVEYASWRWIFFINVPVGAVALLFTVLFLKEEHRERPGRFDLPGFVLAGAGLATLLVSLDQGAQLGWGRPSVWGTLLVSALLIGGLVLRELRTPEPMLDLRLLGDRLFGTGNALLVCSTGAIFGTLFLLPLFLQKLHGFSPFESGLVLMPQALTMLAATQVVSRIYGRFGPRPLLLIGFTVLITVGLALQLLSTTTPVWFLIVLLMWLGLGMGLLMTPLQTAAFARISGDAMGHASSLFNASRQVATALGTAVCATILVAITEARSSTVDLAAPGALEQVQMAAYRGAFLASIGFGVLGLLLSLRVRNADAAATLDDREKPRARAGKRGGDPSGTTTVR